MKAKLLLRACWENVGLKHCVPCVGLVVFMGCGLFVVAPDPEFEPRPARPPPTSSQLLPPLPSLAVPSPMPGNPDVSLPIVVIDPGHGGIDEGCRGHGLKEKDLTLDIASRVADMLKSYNVPAVLTRRDDRYVALPERAAIANAFDRVLFISIHFNQSRGAADGIETYYADQKIPPEFAWTWVGVFGVPATPSADTGEVLAGYIQASLVTKMEARNRGIKSRSLYVVRNVHGPSVLVEGGFISNALEAQMLRNEDYRNRLAAGIAEGTLTYLKLHARPKTPTELASIKH